MKKVSIIIPVYNSEAYLNSLFKNLNKQTYENIEIVLVNDGSTDASYDLCMEYKKGKDNVKVINQINLGVSQARNIGMKNSTGDYISFIDSDDELKNEMYEVLVRNLETYDTDISICSVKTRYLNGKEKSTNSNEILFYNREQVLEEILTNKKIPQGLWCKLFKREVIANLEFRVGRHFSEDQYFFFEANLNSEKTVFQDQSLYTYIKRESSVTTQAFSEKNFDIIYFSEKMKESLVSRNFDEKYISKATRKILIDKIFIYRKMILSDVANEKCDIIKKDIKKSSMKHLPTNKKIEYLLILYLNSNTYKKIMSYYNENQFGEK